MLSFDLGRMYFPRFKRKKSAKQNKKTFLRGLKMMGGDLNKAQIKGLCCWLMKCFGFMFWNVQNQHSKWRKYVSVRPHTSVCLLCHSLGSPISPGYSSYLPAFPSAPSAPSPIFQVIVLPRVHFLSLSQAEPSQVCRLRGSGMLEASLVSCPYFILFCWGSGWSHLLRYLSGILACI